MTTEEAIRYWEKFDSEINRILSGPQGELYLEELIAQKEAVKVCLAALQAQQQQEWSSQHELS